MAEIGFEGITGQASSVLSVPQAVTGTSLTDVARNVFKPAKYGTISKGGDVTPTTKADVEAMVDTMTDEEIRTAQFDIKNDPELSNKITLRKQAAQFDLYKASPAFTSPSSCAKVLVENANKNTKKNQYTCIFIL